MKKILITFIIILLAFFFRFNNLNWDANFHLHPDERFLTMVGTAMKIPLTINQYFNQETSLMNPANIGYDFFVYGRFPLILTKYLAVNLNLDNYNDLTILGRQLSAFFDLLVVIFIFKTVLLLEKHYKFSPSIKYWAAFFYTIAVLPIQLSHFFAVDTFLNFFMFGSFYFSLRVDHDRPLRNIILSAIFFGLAMASKVTAIFVLPLNLILISLAYLKRPSQIGIGKCLLLLLVYFGVAYFSLRLADPYYFQNKNIFDPTLSNLFMENIKSLKNMTVKSMDNWFPPMVQWLNKNTIFHSLTNNIVFGLGVPYSILITFGIGWIILNQFSKLKKQIFKHVELLIILFWVLGFFLYQSLQTTPALRYFIVIYPFLAIFAAIGMEKVINYALSVRRTKFKCYMLHVICYMLLIIWPLMFSSIYFYKHTRVEASEWIYKNLPSNSVILGEYWDDPLPLSVINNYNKQFTVEQLPVFDQDTPEKWQKMNEMLQKADYYVLSSNRGWGSIMTVPEKYPLMSKFYSNLLAGKNSKYKKIKEFKPYYYKFFQLPNIWVDESFTVYDHPEVMIFKKN